MSSLDIKAQQDPATQTTRTPIKDVEIKDSIHAKFIARVGKKELSGYGSPLTPSDVGLTSEQLVEIFHSQVLSRQVDRMARKLQAVGEGFYTVGSSGHECNAAFAEAFQLSDMAFLHYRDAAFQIHRSKRVDGQTPGWDLLLSLAASADEPISAGRHKVLGSKVLNIPPQTSTIASHVPKAVGAALSIGLASEIGFKDTNLEDDGIVICSFGDASANHSTTQGAINTASWHAYQDAPVPIIFVCEDNGIGISVSTPEGWIEAAFSQRPALRYLSVNGLDVLECYKVAAEAEAYTREERKPVFLHMHCARLQGHSGTDVQTSYRTREEIDTIEDRDPLLHTAATLIANGILSNDDVLDLYNATEDTLGRMAEEAAARPKLESSGQVMASIIPPRRESWPKADVGKEDREAAFGSDAVLMDKPQHMARLLNWGLTDLMLQHPNIVMAGEDIGKKGGVYGVTLKLQQRFGEHRVIDTLLDEQSILGLGIGCAHNNILPITEIQFLAYFHNAEDQLRGEAATLSFFSNQQYTNPMIIRIAGLAYQRGFGGHYHNDNSIAALRDVPGVIIACPSNGRDAVAMMRECVRLALEEQRVIVFLEPIALYMTRDLHEAKDKDWTSVYEPPGSGPAVALGEVHTEGQGTDLAIVTYGNGYYMSRQAQKKLSEEQGIDARVIDLRWLAPLPEDALLSATAACDRILIVDECRHTGSQSEGLMALFAEARPEAITRRITAEDSFIPLGNASTLTLPNLKLILAAAIDCVRSGTQADR